MQKKAIIFDLDNTVYPVQAIGPELFASLFELIIQTGNYAQNIDKIKDDIMRRPFNLSQGIIISVMTWYKKELHF